MSIYIDISGKCYKVPNKITIGRGEPFAQFNDNRRVARTHFCLTVSKGSIYIKDLGTSKEGLIINGKKVKPKAQVLLNQNDEIIFADEKMRILPTAPTEYIEIKRSKASAFTSFDYYKIITFTPAIICTLITVPLLKAPKFNYRLAIMELILCSIVTYLCHLYVKFLKRIAVSPLNEVTFNTEGFTIFTLDNVNMTFAFNKIDSWNIEKEKVLKIIAHDEVFEYYMDKNFEDFKKYLQKNLASKKVALENFRVERAVFLLLLPIGIELINNFTNPELQYAGVWILSAWSIMCVAMLFKKEFRKYWVLQVEKKTTPLFQTGSIIVPTLYVFMVVSSTLPMIKAHKSNLAAAAECSKLYKEACLKVDYEMCYTTETKYKNQEIACEHGNKSACQDRAPASVKE